MEPLGRGPSLKWRCRAASRYFLSAVTCLLDGGRTFPQILTHKMRAPPAGVILSGQAKTDCNPSEPASLFESAPRSIQLQCVDAAMLAPK